MDEETEYQGCASEQCLRKVGESKAQQIHITGSRRTLTRPVAAARVTSKCAALLYHSKDTTPAGRTVHTMLCQLRLVSNLYEPRGLLT